MATNRIWMEEPEPLEANPVKIEVIATVVFDDPSEEPNLQADIERCSKLVQKTLKKAGLTVTALKASAVEDVMTTEL